jgi:hypothetical protein
MGSRFDERPLLADTPAELRRLLSLGFSADADGPELKPGTRFGDTSSVKSSAEVAWASCTEHDTSGFTVPSPWR